jgi:hypothetical protein
MREGHAWHAPPTPKVGKGAKPEASAAAQGGGSKNKNKKKKADGSNQPLAGAPTAVVATAAAGGGRGNGWARCSVHNSTRHSTEECHEIKKLAEQYREQVTQQRGDGAPSR